MHRLSGEDDGFLHSELPGQPMHGMALLLLSAPRPISVDNLRAHVASRLPFVPALSWRFKPVPLGLHHPLAFTDPAFRLEDHVTGTRLPAPGSAADLDALVATLGAAPLDRSRPLWDLTLVDGLDDGRQGLVLRFHHALMDGGAAYQVMGTLFSRSEPPGAAPATGKPERAPGIVRLVAGGLSAHVRSAVRLPSLLGRSIKGSQALKARQAASTITLPVPGKDAPRCLLNEGVSGERRFARVCLPLAEVLEVKAAAGVTVNEVAIALCAGALRRYLEARDALPARPLVANVPMGLDAPGAPPRLAGNQWTLLATTLATDVADPWERLLTIGQVTKESKDRLGILGRELLRDWVDPIPPMLGERLVRKEHDAALADPAKVGCNVTVSNLRGPRAPLSFQAPGGQVTVEEVYLAGPPANRLGAVFTLSDQPSGQLTFAVFTVADSVPDPAELAAGLHGSLTELLQFAREGRSQDFPAAPASIGSRVTPP